MGVKIGNIGLYIEKVYAQRPRLLKEIYWMRRLNTIFPNGMNSKVLYQILKE